ncbi:MAG: histidine kinase [Longimicrobiales bacterium]
MLCSSAVLLVVLFESLYRIHRRRYIRLCGMCGIMAAVYLLWGALAPLLGSAVLLGEIAQFAAGYAHFAFLVWAWCEASEGREVDRRAALRGSYAIALLSVVTAVVDAPLYALVTGFGFLGLAAAVAGKDRLRNVGHLAFFVGLVGHGLIQFTGFYTAFTIGESRDLASLRALIQVVVEFQLALGVAIWLLDDARISAVSATHDFHKAQQASLRRFRRLLEQGWDIVELRRRDGSVEWVSPAIERVLGVDLADYVSTEPFESIHPDDRAAMKKLLLAPHQTQEASRIRMLGSDGRYRHLEAVAVDMTRDPEVEAIVVTSRDVTDRFALQKELLEAGGRERRQLGRELHDGLGQLLTGIGFRIAQLQTAMERGEGGGAELAAEIQGLVRSAVTQADGLAHGLSPVSIRSEGIRSALEALAAKIRSQGQADCQVVSVDRDLQDPEVANQIFMIAREASYAAIKTHGSTDLTIGIEGTEDGGLLYIRASAGSAVPEGSRAADAGSSLAGRILKHRAAVIDARLDFVEEEAGTGYEVRCRFRRGHAGTSEAPTAEADEPEPRIALGGG